MLLTKCSRWGFPGNWGEQGTTSVVKGASIKHSYFTNQCSLGEGALSFAGAEVPVKMAPPLPSRLCSCSQNGSEESKSFGSGRGLPAHPFASAQFLKPKQLKIRRQIDTVEIQFFVLTVFSFSRLSSF